MTSPNITQPTFASNSELARRVDEVNLGRGGRVSSAAFLPSVGETYLSVNSVESESIQKIAEFYRNHFQGGVGRVTVSCLKVSDYNAAAKRAGVSLGYDKAARRWVFIHDGGPVEAYRHRPNHLSTSHCGVETVRGMSGDSPNRFARRLAGQPPRKKPHMM